jgi:Holliday junction resolvase RusA-like endonuclease
MYSLKFEISGLPKPLNQMLRAHWTKREREKNIWQRSVWVKCWHLKPAAPLKKAKLILTRFSHKACDYDNLAASFKHVIDGLVKVGVLIDDTTQVTGVIEYHQEKAKPKFGKIRVEVLEREE